MCCAPPQDCLGKDAVCYLDPGPSAFPITDLFGMTLTIPYIAHSGEIVIDPDIIFLGNKKEGGHVMKHRTRALMMGGSMV